VSGDVFPGYYWYILRPAGLLYRSQSLHSLPLTALEGDERKRKCRCTQLVLITPDAGQFFFVCNAARSPHSRHRLCQRCCRPVSRTKSKPPTTSAGHGRPYDHTAQQHRADADVLCPASPSASTTTNHQHRTTYTCHSYHIRHMRHTPYTTTNQPHKDEPNTTPNLKQGRARFNSQAIGRQGSKKAVGPV